MVNQVIVPVVVDTNILVPSLYRQTPILRFVLSGNLILVWNEFMYNEAVQIIHKLAPKYSRIGVSPDEVIAFLDLILNEQDKVTEMPTGWPPVSPDRKDDPFLYAAEVGQAEYIITADYRHMLSLGSFKSIPIGSPRDFYNWAKINRPMENIQ